MQNGKTFSLDTLAAHVGGIVSWPDAKPFPLSISGITALNLAQNGDLSFLTHPRYLQQAEQSQASAMITAQPIAELRCPQLIHKNPMVAVARIAQMFLQRGQHRTGQSSQAFVAETAKVDPSVTLYPFAFVDEGACIDAGTVLYPFVYVGCNVPIGKNTTIFPGAVLMEGCEVGNGVIIHPNAVLGSDGFGFVPTAAGLEKVPQKGRVVIEDDVEVGALDSIDRATFDKTAIGRGSKLDSMVHVGHNVEVGADSMLCGQVGIAGSAKIGKRFIAAGKASIAPGVTITDHVTLGAFTGATGDIKEPGQYLGMPEVKARDWGRQMQALTRLPELIKKVRALEKKVEELTSAR